MQNVADVWSIPRARSTSATIGEKDRPLPFSSAILHVLYAEENKTLAGVAAFSPIQNARSGGLSRDMATKHLGKPARIRLSPRRRANS